MNQQYLLPCIDCGVVVRAERLRCPPCRRRLNKRVLLIAGAVILCLLAAWYA